MIMLAPIIIFTFIHNINFFSLSHIYILQHNRLFTPLKNDKMSKKYTICNSPKTNKLHKNKKIKK